MITAMKSTSGSEYEIKEKFYLGSDKVYEKMIKYVKEILDIKPVRLITTLNIDVKFEIAKQLQKATMCSSIQLAKFLHMKFNDENDQENS